MKRLSREERLGIALAVENGGLEVKLGEKDRKLLRKISKYIYTFPLSECETEDIRKELIGMTSQAELRGESLEEAIGMPYKTFCNELIKAAANLEIPPKREMLRITGTLVMLDGILYLFVAFMYLLMIFVIWAIGMEAFNYPPGVPILFHYCQFGIALITGSLAFYGGRKGRLRCGDRKAADECLLCGIALLILQGAATMATGVAMTQIWRIRTVKELFSVNDTISLIVTFTILILFTAASIKNRKPERRMV